MRNPDTQHAAFVRQRLARAARLVLGFGLAVVLSGCIVAPYPYRPYHPYYRPYYGY